MTRGLRIALTAAAVMAAAVSAAAAGAGNPPPHYQLTLPATVTAPAGKPLTLHATATGNPTVHIGALQLPPGATLTQQDGNPAHATLQWHPNQPGTYTATLTAQNPNTHTGIAKTITLHINPAPTPLTTTTTSHWAFLLHPTAAHTTPDAHSRTITTLPTTTPEHTQNLVLILAQQTQPDGQTWYRARLPILPNNTTGWIQAKNTDTLHTNHTQLIVNRQTLRATLYRNGKPIYTTPIGIGQPQNPTPPGHYYIRDLIQHYNNPFYGPLAYGTSARSKTLTDWPNGGYIGIHGTNQPNLIPGRISHGCIRIPNANIEALHRLLPIGTPITIR